MDLKTPVIIGQGGEPGHFGDDGIPVSYKINKSKIFKLESCCIKGTNQFLF